MSKIGLTRKFAVGVSAGALAMSVFAFAGCAASGSALEPGAHTYHELDSDWELAYGWYEAEVPEGFYANDLGTVFSTTEDRLYTFDNPGMPNESDYRSIQVRVERGLIDDTEVKTAASETAWSNDPDYENAIPFIEMKTTYEEVGERDLGGRTWTVMEAKPATDANVTDERKEPAQGAKTSCKYITQLDDTAYAVVDGYQIAADDDVMAKFIESMRMVEGDYYDTFAQWSLEHSISKKSAAGMW